ncbi:MAG: CGNR zinc finger domain-containing protein [Longimicrobiales bacterium]
MDGPVWVGNELCLDFHNTPLADADALLTWCEAAGTINADAAIQYRAANPAAAAKVVTQANNLRAILHDVFAPIAAGEVPPAENLAEINDFLSLIVVRLDTDAAGFPVLASGATGALSELLAPVVWSAAALLVSPYRDRIGACANEACGRLFVDLSRRGNRRWCDMDGCGNRAKAGRHYARVRHG